MAPRTVVSILVLLLLQGGASAQAQVNLGTWTAESYAAVSGFGAGVWTVAPGGTTVTQSVNGQPTFFMSDFSALNLQIEGQILVAAAGDDDLVGFALGFNPGDTTNPAASYILIDWKRGTQAFNFGVPSCTPGSTAYVGLAASRVFGIPTADELWGHVNLDTSPCSGPTDGVQELARATNLGSTGYAFNTPYLFRFNFTSTSIQVFVNNVLEISLTGLFNNGRVAFYNFSQAGVTYSAFTANCPASWSNYGSGFPGTNGVPTLTLTGTPYLGTTVGISVGNVAGIPVPAYAIFGYLPANTPTPIGGTLLVQIDIFVAIPGLLAPGVTVFPYSIPFIPTLCSFAEYLQIGHLDPGAAYGLAFSPGLEIVLGI